MQSPRPPALCTIKWTLTVASNGFSRKVLEPARFFASQSPGGITIVVDGIPSSPTGLWRDGQTIRKRRAFGPSDTGHWHKSMAEKSKGKIQDAKGRTASERGKALDGHVNRVQADGTSVTHKALGLVLVTFLGSLDLANACLRAVSFGEYEAEIGDLSDDEAADVETMWTAAMERFAAEHPMLREAFLGVMLFARASYTGTAIKDKFLAGIDDFETRAIRAALDGGDIILKVYKSIRGADLFVAKMQKATYDTGMTKVTEAGKVVPVRARRFTDEMVKDAKKQFRYLVSEALHGNADSAFDPFTFAAYLTTLTGVQIVAAENKRTKVVQIRYKRESDTVKVGTDSRSPMQRLTDWVMAKHGHVLPSAKPGFVYIGGLVLPSERQAAILEAQSIGYQAEETASQQIRVYGYQAPVTKNEAEAEAEAV